ncbi:cytochrome P450 [Mycena rebaudengoi]|nr:cytochrome P450 [Mycena rebaudengoi]
MFSPTLLASTLLAYGFLHLVYRVFIYPRFFSPLRNVPGPTRTDPVFGHYLTIVLEEAGIPHREWAKTHGPVVRVFGPFGSERLYFLKPDALQQIVVKGWLDYPRPQYLRDVLGLVAGYGLLTITGTEHKQLRKAMNPAFSITNLMAQTDMYYPPIEGLIEILSAQIDASTDSEQGKVFHVYEWMGKVTLDIICATAFGYETDCLHNPGNELAVAYEHLVALQSGPNIAKLIFVISIPGLPHLLSSEWLFRHRAALARMPLFGPGLAPLVTSMHTIRGLSRAMLADRSVAPDDTATKKDIMSLLVRARAAELRNPQNYTAEGKGGVTATNEKTGEELEGTETEHRDGYTMSDEAMVDTVLTFLGAGHETTASGLSWTLYLLANDPASQARLRAEVTPVYAANPRPDYRTLKGLEWLDCVVNESLRVLPPVPMTIRIAQQDEYVGDVFVPKGTQIYIPIRVINTWKDVWGPDAEEFRPARWLDLPAAYNSTFSQFSFIAGPHGCIGKTMAVVEMKAVLVALIANFEFTPAYAGQVARPATAITMKPEDGMPLRITRVRSSP